jgi:hypothetical protein
MVLQSEILPNLAARGVSVAIAVPDATDEGLRSVVERHGARLIQSPPIESRRLHEYESLLRRYLFEDVLETPSLRAWHLKLKHRPEHPIRNRARAATYLTINRLSNRSRVFRRLLRKAEERLFLENRDVLRVVESVEPTLLVSTYPVSIMEAVFLYAARKAGVTTVSQLLSWDNITTKGRFSVVADEFISWGPIMSEEIKEYYQVPDSRIHECGVAHFDHHVTSVDPQFTRGILSELNLNPNAPYLFFGMSPPNVSPTEPRLVEWLAGAVTDNTWGPDLQLVIRPHPMNLEGYEADDSMLGKLESMANHRVAVDYPKLTRSSISWNLAESDMPRLVNLIAGSSISMNSGSTLAIESIIQDRPTVMTLFDVGEKLPWQTSIRRYLDVPYMRKLIDMGGLRVSRSFDDVVEQVGRYLKDPMLDATRRAETRLRECGPIDGRASERVATVLAKLAGRDSESRTAREHLAEVHG